MHQDKPIMPVVYRFRVTFEDYDEISRDIEIKSTQFFSDFHHCIQSSIGFDNTKPASFYMSNDHWLKGQEISIENRIDKDGNKAHLMHESRLCDYIADPHQKIYYISDWDANWTFRIELIKIIPQGDPARLYPVCIKSTGDAPKQYLVIPSVKLSAIESEEFENLMATDEDETEDITEESDNLMEEAEEGVELDEIEGMSEEGEEVGAEEGESESGYGDAEEESKEDY